jgi:hypothetical protein
MSNRLDSFEAILINKQTYCLFRSTVNSKLHDESAFCSYLFPPNIEYHWIPPYKPLTSIASIHWIYSLDLFIGPLWVYWMLGERIKFFPCTLTMTWLNQLHLRLAPPSPNVCVFGLLHADFGPGSEIGDWKLDHPILRVNECCFSTPQIQMWCSMFVCFCVYIYNIYICMYMYRAGPGCCPEVYGGTNSLFRVYSGFRCGLLGFLHVFTTLLIRFYIQGLLWVSCQILVLAFWT